MAFDFSTLITDRSPEDLQALRDLLATPMSDWTAEQLAEFNRAASKGAYNYTDLNRVIAAMDDINERLTAAGYVTGYHPIVVHPPRPPEPVGPLPEGYTQLEYIESNGTQWINTEFLADQNTRVVIQFQLTQLLNTWQCIIAARDSAASGYGNSFSLWASGEGPYRTDYGVEAGPFFGQADTSKNQADKNKNITTLGSSSATNPAAIFTCNYPLCIFAGNSGGSMEYPSRMRVYSCEIYDNGNLVRAYTPCKDPSGNSGLYDLIGGNFYTNAGSGLFIAGPEVIIPEPEPEPGFDPYIWYEQDVPTIAQMQRYLSNLTAIQTAFVMPIEIPSVPENMNDLSQQEANAIEAMLLVIQAYLVAMQQIVFQSGMAWAVSSGPGWYFGK